MFHEDMTDGELLEALDGARHSLWYLMNQDIQVYADPEQKKYRMRIAVDICHNLKPELLKRGIEIPKSPFVLVP